jgi:multidrug efflux pump
LLTLYTTPVIYLALERLKARIVPNPPRSGSARPAAEVPVPLVQQAAE